MTCEYQVVIQNHTGDLVPRPFDKNIIRYMWRYRHKYQVVGTLEKYKARLVVNEKS